MKKPEMKKLFAQIRTSLKDRLGRINRTDDKTLKKRFLLTLLITVVALIIIARMAGNIQSVLFKKGPKAAVRAVVTFEDEGVPVKAFKVKKTDFKDTLPCLGNIKGFKEVELKFQTSGIIESFNFEEGEKIQEGDIMASLMQRDALLKLKYTEIELNKNQKLFEIGAISPMKLEQAKLEYESAKSDLDKTNIYAISDGQLGSRILDVGNYVTPNDKVGIFVDSGKVYAEFNIIERDVPKVVLGQKAEVFVDAYPNRSYSGVIDRIAPIIEGRSRTQTVKVELDNKDNLLKPGMFVRALISTYEKKDDMIIPASSLKKKENDYFVFVIHKEDHGSRTEASGAKKRSGKKLWPFGWKKRQEDAAAAEKLKEKEAEYGTIETRKITLGYMTQDLVEVDSGLKEDELIVSEVHEDFKDKSKVEISEVQEGLL